MKPSSLLVALALLAAIPSVLVAQDVESLLKQGRGHLVQDNPFEAHAAFVAALALGPDHEDANFLVALTRLLTLSDTTDGAAFLDRLGFSSAGRNPLGWRSELPQEMDGSPRVPEAMSASEVSAFLRNQVLPALQESESNLSRITNPEFELTLTSIETGLDTVTIDRGDAVMLRAMIRFAECFIYTVHGWNWDVQLTALRDYLTDDHATFAQFLNQHPEFLTFATKDDLASARSAFLAAVDAYSEASALIRSRPQNLVRLFTYDEEMGPGEADFRQTLAELKASLQGPVVLSVDANLTIHLARHFSGNAPPRSFLPDFAGNGMAAGTLPDPTLDGLVSGLSRGEFEALLEDSGVQLVTLLDPSTLGPDERAELRFNTVAGHSFALERSSDLANWEEVTRVDADGETFVYVAGSPSASDLEFYRLIDLSGSYLRITGTVRDACSGDPVAGAVVFTDADPRTASSDAEGRYVLQTRSLPGFDLIQVTVVAAPYSVFTTAVMPWNFHVSVDAQLVNPNLPAPSNDDLANRLPLQGYPVVVQGTLCGASREAGESGFGDYSVWYTWTAPESGSVVLRCSGASTEVYTGDTLESLLHVGYEAFDAVVGNTYLIRCVSWSYRPFSMRLAPQLGLGIDTPAPGTPLFAPGPITIGGSLTGLGDTSATLEVEADGKTIFSGDVSGPTDRWSIEWVDVTPGYYYPRATLRDASGQVIGANVWSPLVVHPSNDYFADAQGLATPALVALASNRAATREDGEPAHGEASVWWRWTAPQTGWVTLSAIRHSGDDNDWVLRAYTGSNLTSLTVMDTVNTRYRSECRIAMAAQAGTTYRFALTGWAEDDFQVRLDPGRAPQVGITSPLPDTAYHAGDTLLLTAEVEASGRAIDNVTFVLDGLYLATDDTPPYQTSLTTDEIGQHELQVIALDDQGWAGYSPTVTFEVQVPMIP